MREETKFSEIQLRLLAHLFFLTKGGKYAITGRVIAHWIGGRWSDYRHKLMRQMEVEEAVICQKVPLKAGSKVGRWFYSLTPSAKEYLENQLVMSLENQRQELTSPLEW